MMKTKHWQWGRLTISYWAFWKRIPLWSLRLDWRLGWFMAGPWEINWK